MRYPRFYLQTAAVKIFLFVLLVSNLLSAQDTVKIMSWNLLNYTDNESARNVYYRTVIGSVSPDIFVCQEIADGQPSVDLFYSSVIQVIAPTFAKGDFIDGYDSDNAIFYNPAIFSFVSNTPIHTTLRDITEFKLVKISSGDTLRIYSVHLKASSGGANDSARGREADSLRKVTNLLPAGSNFFVCGDFNFYSSSEQAYIKLLANNPGDDGNFIDPITMPVANPWNVQANSYYHTQSPRVRGFEGGSTGGMDDRFDLMLFSNGIMQSGGMQYVSGSFTAYGNDGQHYNDSINKMPNTAVSADIANGIHYASDHLPIFAKFTFPSSVTTPAAQPTNLQLSNVTNTAMDGSFTAASPLAGGYLVIRKAGSAPTSTPVDGNTYTAGAALGDGVVAYAGTATAFSNAGLTAGTVYYFKVYAYNGSSSSTKYLTVNPLTGSQATTSANPNIQLSTITLSFSATEVNTNSSVQSFTVTASNLSAQLILTPPVDFQISTNSSTGFVSNPATLALTPSSGSIPTTTLYLRFSPITASGSRIDSLLLTSTGASSSKITLSGVSLSSQPTVQSSLNISSDVPGSIVISFTGGNGAKRVLIGRQGSAVSYAPADGALVGGINSNFTTATDLGSGNKPLYSGNGNSVTVTGLSGATQYFFAVYEYNEGLNNSQNYLATSPGTGSFTISTFYSWIGGNGSFATSTNWAPARNTVSASDVLQFGTGDSVRVSNLSTQSIAQLYITNNTKVVFSSIGASVVTIAGGTGSDLNIQGGSALHIRGSGTNTLSISVPTGATGSISGVYSMDSAAHRLLAYDIGSVVFNAGATFIVGNVNSQNSFSGNPFGSTTTNNNTIVFASGSTYIYYSGSNPFGVASPGAIVQFQSGSWFKIGRIGANSSYSGRTYGNIELNVPAFTGTPNGGGSLTFDTLRVLDGSLNFTVSGGVNIKNAIIVEGTGSVAFNPAASSTIQFNGTTPQSISGSGALTFSSLAKVKLNNSAGLRLTKDITIKDSLILSSGIFDIGGNKLTLDTNAKVNTGSASSFISMNDTGEVRKVFTAIGSFSFPVGSSNKYAPVSLTLNAQGGLTLAYLGIRTSGSKYPTNYADQDYIIRSWQVTGSGITSPNYSALFTYPLSEVVGSEANLYSGFWDGSKWNLGAITNTSSHQLTVNNQTSFGSYSAAHSDFMGGSAVFELKAIPQAYYNRATGQLTTSDSLQVYLANTSAPYAFVDSAKALLNASSAKALLTFRNINTGSYNVFVRHRNSLGVWLAQSRSFTKGAYASSDITNDSSSVLGANMAKIDTIWSMYTGDVNNDGIIDFSDIAAIDNDAFSNKTGYYVTDLNGDGVVNYTDIILCEENALFMRKVVTP